MIYMYIYIYIYIYTLCVYIYIYIYNAAPHPTSHMKKVDFRMPLELCRNLLAIDWAGNGDYTYNIMLYYSM